MGGTSTASEDCGSQMGSATAGGESCSSRRRLLLDTVAVGGSPGAAEATVCAVGAVAKSMSRRLEPTRLDKGATCVSGGHGPQAHDPMQMSPPLTASVGGAAGRTSGVTGGTAGGTHDELLTASGADPVAAEGRLLTSIAVSSLEAGEGSQCSLYTILA